MSKYLITITPEHDSSATATAQTTVRVDTSSGQTLITELTVRSADGTGLAPADLPAVDLDLLVQALATRAGGPPALTTEPAVAPVDPPVTDTVDTVVGAAETVAPVEAVAVTPAATSRGGGRPRRPRRRAPRRPQVDPARRRRPPPRPRRPGPPRRRARRPRRPGPPGPPRRPGGPRPRRLPRPPRPRPPASRRRRRSGPAAQVRSRGRGGPPRRPPRSAPPRPARRQGTRRDEGERRRRERAYRRMPDANEVLAVYRQTGTISGMAEHLGVPRHTAAGWARRLRQQGHSIGRS